MSRLAAAQAAAAEQEIPCHTATIEYEDEKGKRHTETASGRDRVAPALPRQGPSLPLPVALGQRLLSDADTRCGAVNPFLTMA